MQPILLSDPKPLLTRKRSFWRGLLAAVATHLIALATFVVAFHFLRPIVWLALSSAPYTPNNAPLDPDTIEWLAIQLGNFFTWFIAGLAAIHWSPPANRKSIYLLTTLLLISVFFAPTPATNSHLRLAIWWLTSPAGVLLGALLYEVRERRFLNPTLRSLDQVL